MLCNEDSMLKESAASPSFSGARPRTTLRNLQALRAFAALWVAVFHLSFLTVLLANVPVARELAALGYAGVDVFFVISGYIMALTTATLASDATSVGNFLYKRFARIYSGWWPFFFLYLAYGALIGGIAPETRLLASFFLWPTLLPHHLLPVAWTLSFELFFYGCTAAVLAWNRRRAWLAMILWAGVVFFLNALWLAGGLFHPDNVADVTLAHWFFFYPLTLEFIAGFLLHELLARRGPGRWVPWAAGTAFFAMLIAVYVRIGVFHPFGLAGLFHAPERALLWGGLSVCLVAAVVRLEARGVRLAAWAEPLGDASYSIYLGHILLIQLFLRGRRHLPPFFSPGLEFAVVLTAGVLLLWLHHRLIERPLYDWSKGLFRALLMRRTMPPVSGVQP